MGICWAIIKSQLNLWVAGDPKLSCIHYFRSSLGGSDVLSSFNTSVINEARVSCDAAGNSTAVPLHPLNSRLQELGALPSSQREIRQPSMKSKHQRDLHDVIKESEWDWKGGPASLNAEQAGGVGRESGDFTSTFQYLFLRSSEINHCRWGQVLGPNTVLKLPPHSGGIERGPLEVIQRWGWPWQGARGNQLGPLTLLLMAQSSRTDFSRHQTC